MANNKFKSTLNTLQRVQHEVDEQILKLSGSIYYFESQKIKKYAPSHSESSVKDIRKVVNRLRKYSQKLDREIAVVEAKMAKQIKSVEKQGKLND